MNTPRKELPFKVIEALFNQFKAINTSDIKDYLGVERIQAQRYFTIYRERHDPKIIYDKHRRKHLMLENFQYHYIYEKDAAKILRCSKFLFNKEKQPGE